MRHGSASRALVENMQIENRLRRYDKVSQESNTGWKPKEVKRPTKKDYYELLKTINTRKYETVKHKKNQQTNGKRIMESLKIGILKKPSMFDLSHLMDHSPEMTSTRNFHGGSSTSLSPMKMPTNRNSTLDLARVNNNGNEIEMLGARSIRSRASNLSITFQLPTNQKSSSFDRYDGSFRRTKTKKLIEESDLPDEVNVQQVFPASPSNKKGELTTRTFDDPKD